MGTQAVKTQGFQLSPEAQTALVGGLFQFLTPFIGALLDKLLHPTPRVSQPAAERPSVDNLPDDKIIPAGPKPVPSAPAGETASQRATRLGYTSLKVNVQKAQYNHELFPDQYDPAKGGNPQGLYSPARQETYNRWSKVWMNATPFKNDHAVEEDEGRTDDILWGIVWVWKYNGVTTVQRANKNVLRDTKNGSGRPIDVVEGESVGLGQAAWDFAHSFLSQTNVGDNEGNYEVHAELPALGLVSETFSFKVS
jgi:hypothetical protein